MMTSLYLVFAACGNSSGSGSGSGSGSDSVSVSCKRQALLVIFKVYTRKEGFLNAIH